MGGRQLDHRVVAGSRVQTDHFSRGSNKVSKFVQVELNVLTVGLFVGLEKEDQIFVFHLGLLHGLEHKQSEEGSIAVIGGSSSIESVVSDYSLKRIQSLGPLFGHGRLLV